LSGLSAQDKVRYFVDERFKSFSLSNYEGYYLTGNAGRSFNS
jgi:hypothetical protein